MILLNLIMNQIVYLVNVCEVIHVQNLITTIDKFLKLQNNLCRRA